MRVLPVLASLAALCVIAATPVAAAMFPANPTRLDPYKNYRFQLRIAGRTVAGMSSLKMPAAVKHRDGGDPSTSHKSPGRDKYEPITLERGLTQDNDFAAWASSAHGAPREVSIVSLDGKGHVVASYSVHRAWVSEYKGPPKLGADGNPIAIEHIKIENEGWEQDHN